MISIRAPRFQRGRRRSRALPETRCRLSQGFERLEERNLLSVSPFPSEYDASTAFVSPVWFQDFRDQLEPRHVNPAMLTTDSAGTPTKIERSLEESDFEMHEVGQYDWIVHFDAQRLDDGSSAADTEALLAGGGPQFQVQCGLGLVGQVLVRSYGASIETVGAWLASNDAVSSFELDVLRELQVTPNDARESLLWGMNNTGQTGGSPDADIDAAEAWEISTGSSQIVVGVIDTGVDYSHPDLAANIWTNPGEIAGNGMDDDGNGFVDDIHGYDFVNDDGDPMDDNGHGTHVSGTIGAVGNNGIGVAGVNWTATIMGLKFLSASGSGYTSDAVRAVNYATMMRARYDVDIRVTNNSWGGGGYSAALSDAIEASAGAGILFVAAAGNSASDNDVAPHYPSNYDLDTIISVAATDHNDHLASFSCYGATTVDLAAPGRSILSTVPGGGYQTYSGTSMATPHVTGVAALAWSVSPDASVTEIRDAILGGVDPLAPLDGLVVTGGRLNALGTLEQLGLNVVGSDPVADSVVVGQPTDFTIDFSGDYDPATVGASDLTVNGAAADSFTLIDADTVTFHFTVSPVIDNGPQQMAISEGAVLRTDGESLVAWQSKFYYDDLAMAVVSTSPAEGSMLVASPTSVVIRFNEAVDPASIGVSDLTLSSGRVTAAVLIDADTVRYTTDIPVAEGEVTFTLVAGELSDAHGTPGPGHVGRFVVDHPALEYYAATNVPLPLIDTGTVLSTITVADESATLVDLDLELDIAHTWDGDLDVDLIAPNGTVVALFTNVGSYGENFMGTILDDEADTRIADGEAPFTGRYRPEGLLSRLDGINPAGTWTLRITDDWSEDTGTLNGWTLRTEVDRPLAFDSIADQTMAHTTDTIDVVLHALDPEGEAISYTARAVNRAYQLDQMLGLYADATLVGRGYCLNNRGLQEKYLRTTTGAGWAYVLPNGEVYQWGGSIANSTLVATLDVAYYHTPSLLYNASAATPVNISIDAPSGTLTIDPADGYAGEFDVEVTATAGIHSVSQTFCVTVTDLAPTFDSIADQTMAHTTDTIDIALHALDPEGEAISYTGRAVNRAYQLDQTLGLYADSTLVGRGYCLNNRGLQEKYLRTTTGAGWAYVLPNGEVYQWGGSIAASTLVATLDVSYYHTPSLLYDAVATMPVSLSFDASSGTLTIDPADGYVGELDVEVTATAGIHSVSQTFCVTVTDLAPTFDSIADQTMPHTTDTIDLVLRALDPEGEAITYTARAVNRAYQLDQTLGLYADATLVGRGYCLNNRGLQEKYVRSTTSAGWAYMLPNGEVYQWGGSIAASTLVATLDVAYYHTPSLLYDASAATPVNTSIDAPSGTLTIDPVDGYAGEFDVVVTATAGVHSVSQTFCVTVTDLAPTFDSVADQTMAHTTDTIDVVLHALDPEGEAISYTGRAVNRAYQLDQMLGLYADSTLVGRGYCLNNRGLQEKYLRTTTGAGWAYVLPNGEVYQWGGSIAASTLVATLDVAYYHTPSLLYNAIAATPVNISIDAPSGTLTIDPVDGYAGQFDVVVTATAGNHSVSQTFCVTVTDLAPTFDSIADQTMAHTTDTIDVVLRALDPEGEAITYTARAVSLAYQLDQTLGLYADPTLVGRGYCLNHRGLQEKYLRATTGAGWAYVLPNGEVYQWGGSIAASTLVATLDVAYYQTPSLLYNASAATPVNISIDAPSGTLTIDPADGYAGQFDVVVTATAGNHSITQTFRVTVTDLAATSESTSGASKVLHDQALMSLLDARDSVDELDSVASGAAARR